MANCWKCHNALRQEGLGFCPLCGASQRPDDPGAAQAWQMRLDPSEQAPAWGLSLLWLLAWPLAPITYPILMARASNRLKRHVKQRLAAPALQSPRFTQSAEGQQILRQLANSAGNLKSSGSALATVLLMLVGLLLGLIFLVPTASPDPITWENGFESIFEVRPARAHYYIYSPEEYQRFWDSNMYYRFSRVTINAGYEGGQTTMKGALPTWADGQFETPYMHRPFEYISSPRYRGEYQAVYRVHSITGLWNGTVTAGVLLYIGLGILVLSYLSWGIVMWVRLMRHSRAEAVAAAYARGDVTLHDALQARVGSRNGGLTVLVVLLVLWPFPPGIFLVLYPILMAVFFARHQGWEKQNGILTSLGLAGA